VGFFFVERDRRRQGIGRTAGRDLITWLAGHGAGEVRCSPAGGQFGALALAKELGFENVQSVHRRLGNRDTVLHVLARRTDDQGLP
jgi:GNAT superfamily N-acetyltransferase